MTLDIRTKVTITRNDTGLDAAVLSCQCSDSGLPGAGLIFTRGTLELVGRVDIHCGNKVNIFYSIGGKVFQRLPRDLYALGKTYNPIANTTKVELGCRLTMYQNTFDEKVLTADLTLINSDEYIEGDQKIITVPIFVNDILDFCAGKIGLNNAIFVANTEGFSVPYFDLSSGYVNILNDLLLSYGRPAYAYDGLLLDAASKDVSNLKKTVINLSPLSIGEPIPAEYRVKYNYLTLKKYETPDPEKLNWEKQESYGLKTTITIDNPVEPSVGGTTIWNVPDFFQYTYTPYTLVETQYDSYDRVVTRVTTTRSIVAELAPSYIQHIAGKYLITTTFNNQSTISQLVPPEGSTPIDTIRIESITYKVKAPSVFKGTKYPTGYEEIESEETVTQEPVLKLTGSTNVYSIAGQANVEFSYGASPSQRFVAERQVRTYEVSKGQEGQQISKTLTTQYLCQAYTQEGQQIVADALQKIGNRFPFDTAAATALFNNAQIVKQVGTTSEINSGREVGLQQRPPQAERTNSAYKAERINRSITGTADGRSGTRTYSMPYAPDDIFAIDRAGNAIVYKKSSADQRATDFGQIQSKYDYGIRNGVNVQAGLLGFPSKPCSKIEISLPADNVSGFGRIHNVAYTFDQNGGIVSADVLSSGIISSSPKQIFISQIAYQPPNPVIDKQVPDRIIGTLSTVSNNAQLTIDTAFPTRILGDGVQALDTAHFWVYKQVSGVAMWVDVGKDPVDILTQFTVVPLYSGRQNIDFDSSTSVQVQSLPYALSLLTTLALTTKTAVDAARILAINVPLSDVSITAYAPAVRIGAAVAVPTSTLAAATLAPAVAFGAAVQVPLSTVGVAALVPEQAGPDGAVVLVPATSIAVAALVPEGVGANLETFYNSWRLQVYGTDAWVFPDWWAD